MVTPRISTEAINTNRIIDTKIRDLSENFLNKVCVFRSKLANIAPKKASRFIIQKEGIGLCIGIFVSNAFVKLNPQH